MNHFTRSKISKFAISHHTEDVLNCLTASVRRSDTLRETSSHLSAKVSMPSPALNTSTSSLLLKYRLRSQYFRSSRKFSPIHVVPWINHIEIMTQSIYLSWWRQRCHPWRRPQLGVHALQREWRSEAPGWCHRWTWASFEPLPLGWDTCLDLRRDRWTLDGINVLVISC